MTRLDKWLWAARFYKTRGLAVEEIGKGRVAVNGQVAKASRDLHAGDVLELRQAGSVRTLTVAALSDTRAPAPVAQALYVETAESIAAREAAREARRLAAASGAEPGRPTKRDRRRIDDLVDWQRWSAAIDDHKRK